MADDPATGANDPATDADGDTITVQSVATGVNGTTAVSAPASMTYTPTANVDGAESFMVTITDGKGATATTTVTVSIVSAFRWVGLGGDTNWNTNLNWCGAIDTSNGACSVTGGTPAGASDRAWFGTWAATANATINTAISIGGLTTNAGYTGTITQNLGMDVTVGSLNWLMNDGIFLGDADQSSDFSLTHSFRLKAAATFTAPGGNFTFAQTISTSTMAAEFLGTFNHNSGTIRFNGTYFSGAVGNNNMVDVTGTASFNHMIINMYNTANGAGNTTYSTPYLEMLGTITVEGNLTMTSGNMLSGTLNLNGNLSFNCSGKHSCANTDNDYTPTKINFVGPNDSTYSVIDESYQEATLPRIGVGKDNNSVRVYSANDGNVRFTSLEITMGEFEAVTGVLKVGKDWGGSGSGAKTYGFSNTGGVYTHNNGTLHLRTTHSPSSTFQDAFVVNTTTATSLYDLIIDLRKTTGSSRPEMLINAGIDLTVENTLVHESGQLNLGGIIKVTGPSVTANCVDTSSQCAWKSGLHSAGSSSPANISFEGAAPQTYSFANSNAYLPRIRINKTALANTVSPLGVSDLNVAAIHITQGTLNLPSTTTRIGVEAWTTSGVSNSGIFMAAGAGSGAIAHNNGKVIINTSVGDEGYTFYGQIDLNNRTLNLYDLTVDIYGNTASDFGYVNIATGDLVVVENDYVTEAGSVGASGGSSSTTRMEIWGDVTFNCSAVNRCSYGGSTAFTLRGSSKTITQAAGAQFNLRYVNINLTDNTQTLTLLSDINARTLAGAGVPWADITLTKGIVDLNGHSFTGINLLTLVAGASCTGPLVYASAAGATGTGCGP